MPLGRFQCKECGETFSTFYKGRGTEAAKEKECACGGGVSYVFCPTVVKMDFEAGIKYGTGLDQDGKGVYFNTKREMISAMDKQGIKPL